MSIFACLICATSSPRFLFLFPNLKSQVEHTLKTLIRIRLPTGCVYRRPHTCGLYFRVVLPSLIFWIERDDQGQLY